MEEGLLSQRKYALRRGVSRQYIGRLVKAGAIPTQGGKIDAVLADAILDDSQPVALGPNLSLTEARTAEIVWRGRLRRLEYEQKTGKLVSVEDFEQVMGEMIGAARAKLLNLGSKLGPLMPQCATAAEAKDLIDGAVVEVLRELSTGTDGSGDG